MSCPCPQSPLVVSRSVSSLASLEGKNLNALGWRTPQAIHLLAEAERRAFARRNALLGDPAFVKIPVASFLSKDTAAALRAEIGEMSSGSAPAVPAKDKRHTTCTRKQSL